jgi:hypothetical protein
MPVTRTSKAEWPYCQSLIVFLQSRRFQPMRAPIESVKVAVTSGQLIFTRSPISSFLCQFSTLRFLFLITRTRQLRSIVNHLSF